MGSVQVPSKMGLFLVLLCVGLVVAQDKEKTLDKAGEELRKLGKSTGLDLKESFRCGLFFPDPKDDQKLPIAPLLILNATWPAEECQSGVPNTKRYNAFCDSLLFSKLTNKLSLSDPSINKKRRGLGMSIGDDSCGYLKLKVKIPFVGAKSKKFPKGLEIGMFSNACGVKKWHATGLKHGEKVCCRAGEYKPC